MNLLRIKTSALPQLLVVRVKNPETTIFEGHALALTSVNKDGKFDVLPYHTNFISLIKETLIIYVSKEKNITLSIQGGIMKVRGNTVYIYLGIAPSQSLS